MIKKLAIITFFFFCITGLFGQTNDPIWGIGTKWTYELDQEDFNHTITYLVNEIVDTTTINNMKLYVVNSEPYYSGIQYFYYNDGKVYNYNLNDDILELLYEFNVKTNYITNYRPICDPYFPYDSLPFKQYTIKIDSIVDFEMPDGAIKNLQYVSNMDTLINGLDTMVITNDNYRSILADIGFFQGGISYTHNWEIGMYICDEYGSFVTKLRCFENDSISYNFVGYPCDSTWMLTSTDPIAERNRIKLFPNPTSEVLNISGTDTDVKYEIYSYSGILLEQGETQNKTVHLKEEGFNIIRFYLDGTWIYKRIYKSNN